MIIQTYPISKPLKYLQNLQNHTSPGNLRPQDATQTDLCEPKTNRDTSRPVASLDFGMSSDAHLQLVATNSLQQSDLQCQSMPINANALPF